ncbi:hypothetical protein KI387_006137, partial [Taxus chinensis]
MAVVKFLDLQEIVRPWPPFQAIPITDQPRANSRTGKVNRVRTPIGDYPAENHTRMGMDEIFGQYFEGPQVQPCQMMGASWFSTLKRAGGGCNDLVYSGHMLVAVLTAMAWT